MSTPQSLTPLNSTKEELSELFNILTTAHLRSSHLGYKDAKSSSKRFSLPIQESRKPKPKQERTRRNTVASIIAQDEYSIDFDTTLVNDEDTTDVESPAGFSCADEKKYPFAFKLPIHKLYPKSEWFQKVLDTLEDSKDRFKPLAEKVVYAASKEGPEDDEAALMDDGAVRFRLSVVPPPGSRARRTSVLGERRLGISNPPLVCSQSGANISPTKRTMFMFPKSPALSFTRLPPSGDSPTSSAPSENEEMRALKKRCVGRDKAMDDATSDDESPSSRWFYNAAVSACESPAAASFVPLPPAVPPTTTRGGKAGYSPLLAVGGLSGAVNGSKRRICESVPSMKTGQIINPLGHRPSNSRLVTGRRGLMAHFNNGGCEVIVI